MFHNPLQRLAFHASTTSTRLSRSVLLRHSRPTSSILGSHFYHSARSTAISDTSRPEDMASVSTFTTSEIRPTKVAVFSSQKFERDFLMANPSVLANMPGLTLEYYVPRLTSTTAHMAEGADAVCAFVNDTIDRRALETMASKGTKCVLMRCAGYNNVDLEAAKELGIAVLNVPQYSPHAVAEFAVSLLLTVIRKTHKAFNRVRESNFALQGLMGSDLGGSGRKTVGVVGTGKIGRIFARIMGQGFGCKIVAYDQYHSQEALDMGVEYVDSLDDLYKQSDIISLHCPLTAENHHMINKESISQMKKGVILINTSRGGLVNIPDLIQGLRSKQVYACGFDVVEGEHALFFEDHSGEILENERVSELLTFPNVLMTPHLAFCTDTAMENIWSTTLGNLQEYLDHDSTGAPFSNAVSSETS